MAPSQAAHWARPSKCNLGRARVWFGIDLTQPSNRSTPTSQPNHTIQASAPCRSLQSSQYNWHCRTSNTGRRIRPTFPRSASRPGKSGAQIRSSQSIFPVLYNLSLYRMRETSAPPRYPINLRILRSVAVLVSLGPLVGIPVLPGIGYIPILAKASCLYSLATLRRAADLLIVIALPALPYPLRPS